MAVLINTETKQGENLSPEQQKTALEKGTHGYALVDPEGDIVSSTPAEYHSLLASGHKPASEQQLKDLLTYAKHSTPLEQAKSVAEGVGRGLLPFGISTAIERGLGANPEDIRGREEVNPGLQTAGEVAGLAGSALVPGGQLKVLGKAGESASLLVSNPLARKVIKHAAEMAMLQEGDEVRKIFVQDPEQSLQTAMTSIGLSSLLGGGLGAGSHVGSKAVQLLWDTSKGLKIDKILAHATSELEKIPAEYLGAAFGAATHGPMGFVIGHTVGKLAKTLGKKALNGIETALLKNLSTEEGLGAGAFKAVVDMAEKAYKGAKLIDAGVDSVFKVGGKEVIAEVNPKDLAKLHEQVKQAMVNPEDQLEQHQNLAAALPEHMQAIGELKAKSVQYLNSIRPNTDPTAPMDPPRLPNPVEDAKYNKALRTAQQPLTILDSLRKGTLDPQDVVTISTLYPKVYALLQQKLGQKIIDMKTKGQLVPYNLQMGLGLFMGMPLESSTLPQNIMANQAFNKPQQPAPTQKAPTANQSKALSKLSQQTMTPGQAREQSRGSNEK